MRTKYITRSSLFQYFLILLFIISHNSWFYSLYDMKFRYLIIAISLMIMVCLSRTRNNRILLLLGFYTGWLLILDAYFSGVMVLYKSFCNALFLAEPILIAYVTYHFDKDMFATRYMKVISFLAFISLIFFLWGVLDVNTLLKTGLFKKISGLKITYTPYYCNLLYCVRTRELYRNVGMFCEPGLYQIVLSAALYLLFFYSDNIKLSGRSKIFCISILTLTLLTAVSATGYISLIIITGGVLLDNRKLIAKNIRKITALAVVAILLLALFDLANRGENSFVYHSLIEKLIGINNSEATTGSVRFSTIILCLKMLLKNPFGYGYIYASNYLNQYAAKAVGARIVITAAAIGIIPFLLIMFFFIWTAFKNRRSNLQFFVLLFLYLNISLAQSREFYPALLVLMFFSVKSICHKESASPISESEVETNQLSVRK